MTFSNTSQNKSTVKQDILDKLLLIKEIKKCSQIEIARTLGYKKDVFSEILSGYGNGSAQLSAAMDLLIYKLANEELRDKEKQKVAEEGRIVFLNDMISTKPLPPAEEINYRQKSLEALRKVAASSRAFVKGDRTK